MFGPAELSSGLRRSPSPASSSGSGACHAPELALREQRLYPHLAFPYRLPVRLDLHVGPDQIDVLVLGRAPQGATVLVGGASRLQGALGAHGTPRPVGDDLASAPYVLRVAQGPQCFSGWAEVEVLLGVVGELALAEEAYASSGLVQRQLSTDAPSLHGLYVLYSSRTCHRR